MIRVIAFLIAICLLASVVPSHLHAHDRSGTALGAQTVVSDTAPIANLQKAPSAKVVAEVEKAKHQHDGKHEDCPDCKTCHHSVALISRKSHDFLSLSLPIKHFNPLISLSGAMLSSLVEPPRA